MNNNELDNLIKNIYSKQISEPPEFEMAIRNAFKDKKKIFIKQKIMKLATVMCSFVVILSGIVYAKDIEKYFKSLFTNSTESIDSAVENGYFQAIDMDFIYDNDIGIKVDNLVLDDLNLDISFCYTTSNKNIKSICLEQYKIFGDNEELIYEYNRDKASVGLANYVNRAEKHEFDESILFGLRRGEYNFNKIYFEINSLTVSYIDNNREIIKGKWNFDIKLSNQMKKNSSIYYALEEENEYVKSCTGILSETGLLINLELKNPIEKINKHIDICELFNLRNNNIEYKMENIEVLQIGGNIENIYASEFSFKYGDVGKYSSNIDLEKFELYIVPLDISIFLTRVHN